MSEFSTLPAAATADATPAPAEQTPPAAPPMQQTPPAPAPPVNPLGRAPEPQPADPNGAPPEWIAALPAELQGEQSLVNFKSIEDLARGYIETKRVASSKVTLPKDDDPASFDRFAAAARPEDPSVYEIPLLEGQSDDFAEAMRPIFHQAGLHPKQVKMLVEANNAYVAEFISQENQRGAEELSALEAEMGAQAYNRGKQAAVNMLDRLGIKPKFEEDLSRVIGTGDSMRLLFDLAERMGELGRVDASDVSLAMGALKGDAALEAARAMAKDPVIGPKLADPNSPERKKYDKLIEASAQS